MGSEVVILFLVLALGEVTAEPACSKYDYEEKLLERMIKVQFDVNQFTIALDKMKAEIEVFMKKSTQLLSDETSKLQSWRDNANNELKTAKQDLEITIRNVSTDFMMKDESQIPKVLFRARGLTKTSFSHGDALVLPTVEVNEGSGYDNNTGRFSAPVQGYYSFATNLCVELKADVRYSIMKGDQPIAGTRDMDFDRIVCSTITVFEYLETGEEVWIKLHVFYGKLFDSYDNLWNTFSGVLLHL